MNWLTYNKTLFFPFRKMEGKGKTFHEIIMLIILGIFFIAVFIKIVFF